MLHSDLISLIQLSVGLNLTFASLTTFLDAPLEHSKSRLRQTIDGITDLQVLRNKDYEPTLKKLSDLDGELSRLSKVVYSVVYQWVRPACFVAGLLSIALLIYSSLHIGDYAENLYLAIILGTLVPLLIVTVYLFFSSVNLEINIESRRRRIESEIISPAE